MTRLLLAALCLLLSAVGAVAEVCDKHWLSVLPTGNNLGEAVLWFLLPFGALWIGLFWMFARLKQPGLAALAAALLFAYGAVILLLEAPAGFKAGDPAIAAMIGEGCRSLIQDLVSGVGYLLLGSLGPLAVWAQTKSGPIRHAP